MICGGLWWFVMVHGGLWWFRGDFVVVHGGLWWFSCGGFMVVCGGSVVVVLWWFVLHKSLEKGHVTLYLTNHRSKFTKKSHF